MPIVSTHLQAVTCILGAKGNGHHHKSLAIKPHGASLRVEPANHMKRIFISILLGTLFCAVPALRAGDANLLAGKWSLHKVNQQYHSTSQTIEVKGSKFVFQMLDKDGEVVLHAEGDLKLEKLGPFSLARFVNIRGGESPSSLQDVDDEYNVVYVLDGDTWTIATNFDKERDERPAADIYQRVASSAKTLVIDEIEMADTPQSATWYFCFEATAGTNTRRHHLENKGYDKNQVRIPIALQISGAKAGQKCSFKMQLDDVAEDVCSDEVDNRSTGEFSISDRGEQTFKPESNWRYTVRWHLQ